MKVKWKRPFWKDDDGTILAEALIVIPFVTIFAIGILEFGNVFWQRHLLEVGVRDAARYWARCRPVSNSEAFMPCSQQIARNIAFYGEPVADAGSVLRVPNWNSADDITIEPTNPPTEPTADDTVVVTGTMSYLPSPVFGFLNLEGISISYRHEQRYYGW